MNLNDLRFYLLLEYAAFERRRQAQKNQLRIINKLSEDSISQAGLRYVYPNATEAAYRKHCEYLGMRAREEVTAASSQGRSGGPDRLER